jgi:hypothetical protein
MERNPGIKRQLDNWALWINSGNSVGTGYPRKVNFIRIAHSHDGDATPVDAVEASKMDDAIKSLIGKHSHLHVTIMHYYRDSKEIKDVALCMIKSPSTIKTYLCQADALLEAWLQAESRGKRGLPVQTPAQHQGKH